MKLLYPPADPALAIAYNVALHDILNTIGYHESPDKQAYLAGAQMILSKLTPHLMAAYIQTDQVRALKAENGKLKGDFADLGRILAPYILPHE